MTAIQKADKQEILSPLEYIDSQITKLLQAELKIEQGWAQVGLLLSEVSQKELWKHEYDSFRAYLNALEEKHVGRKATQLFAYKAAVESLSPYASPKQLNTMGIAMAQEISKAVKRGVTPPADIIEAAQMPTNHVSDIRKLLFDAGYPQNGQEDKGKYHDLGGIYCSQEQWLVISSARETALRTDPVCQHPTEWGKTLDWLLKLSMEFLGAHGNGN